MARLSDEIINRIKSEISLLDLIRSQGYEPKKHGKDYILSCPFHDDRTPSLIISPETNLWHCMGACQIGGSVIESPRVCRRHFCLSQAAVADPRF